MEAAVADCESVEACLTPEWVASFTADVAACRLLVLDCNCSAETLAFAARLAGERRETKDAYRLVAVRRLLHDEPARADVRLQVEIGD